MAIPTADFMTFVKDIRHFGGGSPVAYRYDPSGLAEGAGSPILQGEMVAWASNTSTPVLVRWVRDASAGKFVGIARESAKGVQRLGNQAALTPTELSVFTTGVHNLRTSNGETYNEGDAVFMAGTNTDQVTKTAGGGTQIGKVFLPMDPAVVGDGTKRVPVIIDEYTNYAGV